MVIQEKELLQGPSLEKENWACEMAQWRKGIAAQPTRVCPQNPCKVDGELTPCAMVQSMHVTFPTHSKNNKGKREDQIVLIKAGRTALVSKGEGGGARRVEGRRCVM